MKITLKLLKELNACKEGIDYFKNNDLEGICIYNLITQLIDEEKKYSWVNWILSHVLDNNNKVKYTIFAAELVLHIFENKYPDDRRPRKAIEAAKKYVENQTEENKKTADAAAYAAADAANADAAYANAYAAAAAAYAAAYAAAAAAYAAADAAYAAANAAYAAADAVDAAAKKEIYEKIIDYGIKLLKEQEQKHD